MHSFFVLFTGGVDAPPTVFIEELQLPYRLCAESTFVSNISEKECKRVVDAPRTVLIQLLDDVGTRGLKSETKLKKQERPR